MIFYLYVVPAPTSIIVSSSIPNPIPPFGSDVTMTCTVELSPSVDVPVTVTTVWTGPAGFMTTNTAQPVMGSTTTYTSTAMVSSFGRSDSGVYNCRAHISSASTNAFISDSNTEHDSTKVTTGEMYTKNDHHYFMIIIGACLHCVNSSDVYLALRGIFIANNSQVNIRNIGQSYDNPTSALQCITDRTPCCLSQNPRHGEWYQPSGALVQGTTSNTTFYRNRGDNGEVFLNRPSDVMSPTGQFCCEVPDATDTNQTLCVSIGEISLYFVLSVQKPFN